MRRYPPSSFFPLNISPGAAVTETRPWPAAPDSMFTVEECQVLILAPADGRRILRVGPRAFAVVPWLFGAKQSPALANPRLEALWRGTILLRLERRLSEQEEAYLRSQGFSHAQFAYLKPCAQHMVVPLGVGILVLCAIASAYFGLDRSLDDPIVSATMLLLAVLAIVLIVGQPPTSRYGLGSNPLSLRLPLSIRKRTS